MQGMVRTRIAPSPTGENLHIGNVYTGLINYAFAKKHNGQFIIRIEDTDRSRFVEGSEGRILHSLNMLGLTYDEGPDIGGPFAPYRQSERLAIYHKYAQELVDKGYAEFAFYPKENAGQKKEYAKKHSRLVTISDTKENAPATIDEMITRGDWVVRMKIPKDETITMHDVIRGEISFSTNDISKQVLVKSDGYPTYHLGVVVDDYLMKITHVIRAEEWISSTPKHILLYRYFGWELPLFAHVPLLRNSDHSKLSKRKSPVWVSWYFEQGYLPEAVLNYLALLGWSHPEEKELFSLEEFVRLFNLKDMHPVGPVFDLTKLQWMNGEYIRCMPNEKLTLHVFEFLNKKYSKEVIEDTIPLVRDRVKTLAEYFPLCEFFFQRPASYDLDLTEYKQILARVISKVEALDTWKADDIGNTLQQEANDLGMKQSEFFMMLRVAITGKKISPPLNESMELLGKEKVLEYLKQTI